MMVRYGTLAVSALALAGCSGEISEEARMRLPRAPEAEMEQTEITGLDYGRRGAFRFANAGGTYVRNGGRADLLGYGGNSGHLEFTLEGEGVEGRLAAFCSHSQADVALSEDVQLKVKPLTYRCKFERDGLPLEASLEMHERGIFAAERRGSLLFEGQRLELRSVHKSKAGKLPSKAAVGYVFLQNGREIGGVDTLGSETRHAYLPRDPALREAAMV
ncbi:MAG TPA: hypothetical protein VI381_01305, partial [Allosphingosinicella sp.]